MHVCIPGCHLGVPPWGRSVSYIKNILFYSLNFILYGRGGVGHLGGKLPPLPLSDETLLACMFARVGVAHAISSCRLMEVGKARNAQQ